MRGTLAEGDSLWVQPVPVDVLQPGDVVAFRSGKMVLAHRIVGRSGENFLTQGDGNWRRDSALLAPDQVLGRVDAREHAGVRRTVVGGRRGRCRAAFLHVRAFLRWLLLGALAPLYRLLRVTRAVRLLWQPRITVVRYLVPAGSIVKYIHRGRTAACWKAQEQDWTCRKPYDLILRPPAP